MKEPMNKRTNESTKVRTNERNKVNKPMKKRTDERTRYSLSKELCEVNEWCFKIFILFLRKTKWGHSNNAK